MKTKTIPFDLETAKKIQAGEIKGKVYFKTKLADESKTYTFNLKSIHNINNPEFSYYGLFECDGKECIEYIRANGYVPEQLVTLIIEVSDNKPQFKPFDKVLVRNDDEEIWQPRLYEMYSGGTEKHYCQDGQGYLQCIPYESNEHLVSTTNNPKEE